MDLWHIKPGRIIVIIIIIIFVSFDPFVLLSLVDDGVVKDNFPLKQEWGEVSQAQGEGAGKCLFEPSSTGSYFLQARLEQLFKMIHF